PRIEFLVKPGQIGGNVRFLLTQAEHLDDLLKSGVLHGRNPHEIFNFKMKKSEFRLVELDGK
ncbi:MAG: hypothetical protein WC637_16155, partial [Victivallales bacterium]